MPKATFIEHYSIDLYNTNFRTLRNLAKTYYTQLGGAVVAQLIRPWTFIPEIPGSNPCMTLTVVPLDKALYSHCLVPWKELKAVAPLVACL